MARGNGTDIIIDLKTGVMTTLDGKKKTYYSVTPQDIEQLKIKMDEQMNTPEGKKGREFVNGLSQGMATEVEVKKTGQTRKIAGFNCEEWTIKSSSVSTMKQCVPRT